MAKPPHILEANLAALRWRDPSLAERLLNESPASLRWEPSRAGPLWASVPHQGRVMPLASRYDPLAEAEKLAQTVDPSKHAVVVLLGLGLGHHVGPIAKRIGTNGLLVLYEPDWALLRSVLERIDHTEWLRQPNVIVVEPDIDRAGLLGRVERFSTMLAQGTMLVTHPPSRRLHGQSLQTFGKMVTEVLAFCRTNVVTALVNAPRTYWNLANNLPHYAAGMDTDDLYHAAKGYPAVCVGAGPSLARNVQLLADTAVRRRVVVISAQTTLKPLLDRGIKPDFVTALDYHEISRRFYEGLPDLPSVTLVAEPQAHPTILDSFPGPVRVTKNSFLDLFLSDMAKPRVAIPYGATVAHLSFYLAQHLGCDPIILIGQDLGFSEGLYYCPGTAIHDVWAPELGPFNTLEMMEWQRIVRHRGHLQKLDDIHGQPIFSDEQMLTYLKQFERDFAKAPQTIIDATQGGLPKSHTTRMALSDALAQYATQPVKPLPLASRQLDQGRLARAAGLLQQRCDEVAQLGVISRKTLPLLKKMQKHRLDQRRMRKLFAQLEPMQKQVADLSEAFNLLNSLNTTGAFKRARADRAIEMARSGHIDEYERQRRQLERDVTNVDWLIQSCEEATRIFREALDRIKQFRAQSVSAESVSLPESEAA